MAGGAGTPSSPGAAASAIPTRGGTIVDSPIASPSLSSFTTPNHPSATAHSQSSPTSGPTPPPPSSESSQFRPSPVRSFTVGYPYLSSAKSRAASQPPAGEKLPNSSPASGRGSPSVNGGSEFGVIGGSRTPNSGGRFVTAADGAPRMGLGPGNVTRASSFSVAEKLVADRPSSLVRTLSSHVEERSGGSKTSSPAPFPTFSPTSSAATSPSASMPQTLPNPGGQYSPPIAPANVSRSRSQSFATGVRPDRTFMAPFTAVEPNYAPSGFRVFEDAGWRKDGSNLSPFTSGMRSFLDRDDSTAELNPRAAAAATFRTPQEPSFGTRTWTSPNTQSALSSSVANALGSQPTYSSVVGGFDDAANGGRSGTSSRRHSMSVVGSSGRRAFAFSEAGQGMSLAQGNNGASGRRHVGSLGFTDEELVPEQFSNALNLRVDDGRKRTTSELEQASSSLPIFSPRLADPPRGNMARSNPPRSDPFLESAPIEGESALPPPRGRFGSYAGERKQSQSQMAGSPFSAPRQASPDRTSREHSSKPGPIGAPIRGGAPPAGSIGGGPIGPIGGPFDSRFGPAPGGGGYRHTPFPGAPIGGGSVGPGFNRPPGGPGGFGFFGGIGQNPPGPGRPPFAQNGGFGSGGGGSAFGPGFPSATHAPGPSGGGLPGFPTTAGYFGGPQQPPPPAIHPPTSSPSSFSSLSLADLGKGTPLASLPPNTPLYIVTFKAGRRDVFYCPDPTLLISNGDRVIVEADRGSDLGTVVYDQLTPVEVREWQERQATAALLSGASQHQPPGMAMAAAAANTPGSAGSSGTSPTAVGATLPPTGGAMGASSTTTGPTGKSHGRNGSFSARNVAPGAIDFTGADLNTLLSGVGPSGSQMDMSGGGIGARGPLAKEIMPKRIFAKSAGGPEEQARMMEKLKEEFDAMMICREKVAQRGLPMQIVDAEYQWDRRKLTFYFKAEKRVDFRELTKENFRIFKSRIWMSMVPKDDPRGM